MTEPTSPTNDTPPSSSGAEPGTEDGAREPATSPQRRLVESISAYEVDPPPPSRVREDQPDA